MAFSLLRIHRWCGWVTALFLMTAGLSGALISWDNQLDALCNPELFNARSAGTALSVFELAKTLEAQFPQVAVTLLPLKVEPGRNLVMWVQAKVDPVTQTAGNFPANQIFVDPVSGAVVGMRQWGSLSLQRANIVPLLYRLHSHLLLPDINHKPVGAWLMGAVALVWLIDAMVAIKLAFPHRRRWRKSLTFRWRHGGARLGFDWHRSLGVWLWLLLVPIAFTGVTLSFSREWVRPAVGFFSPLTANPISSITPAPPSVTGPLGFEALFTQAVSEGQRLGWSAPPGLIAYLPALGIYGVGYFEPGQESRGLGYSWLYFDGHTGSQVAAQIPGQGSAGDVFLRSQFPVHSGRFLGLFGRVLMTVLGLAVAGLAFTGLRLTWRRLGSPLNKSISR